MMQLKNNIYKKKPLLDTSAIIALLKKEPGYEILQELIAVSSVSTVNLCELISVLIRNGITEQEVDEITLNIVPEIIPFTQDITSIAGKLIKHTKEFGLSLGDRACLATGMAHDMTIYTTDQIWQKLTMIKVDIVVIR